MASDNLYQLLIGYGLTTNQSKVYSTLTQYSKGLNAKQISEFSRLAQETVYRNLLDLTKMGLVENTIEVPKKYFAIPIKRALFNLHDQKKIQLKELETLTTEVLINYKNKMKNDSTQEGYQFVLVPQKKQLEKTISNKISDSINSVKIITSWKRHVKSLIIFEKAIKQALKNGVTFQILVAETTQEHDTSNTEKFFQDHPKTLVKFIDSPAKTVQIIIDNKETLLITEPEADLTDSPALWSNNSSLVEALLTCFDLLWKKVSAGKHRKCNYNYPPTQEMTKFSI